MRKSTARILVDTKCLSCGKKVSETFGGFAAKKEPTCLFCGGKLDPEPLRKFALAAIKDFKAAFEADVKFRQFFNK